MLFGFSCSCFSFFFHLSTIKKNMELLMVYASWLKSWPLRYSINKVMMVLQQMCGHAESSYMSWWLDISHLTRLIFKPCMKRYVYPVIQTCNELDSSLITWYNIYLLFSERRLPFQTFSKCFFLHFLVPRMFLATFSCSHNKY